MGMSRRTLLSGLCLAGVGRSSQAQTFCKDGSDVPVYRERGVGSALGDLNDRVPWGLALGAPALYDTRLIETMTAEKPRFLAIANALKFGDRNPHAPPDRVETGSWKECDDVVALARRLKIPVRGDCLSWNDWLPQWLKTLARERPPGWRDLARDSFERHFKAVFDHFDDIRHADGQQPLRWCGVVNEPFNPWKNQGGLAGWREGPWLDVFDVEADGVPGYIHRAFTLSERWAPPGATLFLNESFCESDRHGRVTRPALLRLVDALQRAGRNVGAIGLECHLMPQWMRDPANPDWRPFVIFLRDLAARGVAIYLTELDVSDCSRRDGAQRDALVASYVGSFVSAALEVPAVAMLSNWDFSDKYAWYREDTTPSSTFTTLESWGECVTKPPCPRPDIYDEVMRPKPAREALAEALRRRV